MDALISVLVGLVAAIALRLVDNLLARAVQLLGDEYQEQFLALRAERDTQRDEIRQLNQRLTDEIERRLRAETHAGLLDQKAAEMGQMNREQAQLIVKLRRRLEEFEGHA